MKRKAYFSVFKVLQFFLLILLLLSFLLISGCSPISSLLFGPSGSLEVTTYPSGAKIFINGKDTGNVTPHTITNLTKGTYEVKVTLGDISYSGTAIVYSNQTTDVYKDLLPHLKKIIVQPSYMNLKEGESQKIDSVTDYYSDSGSTDLTLSDCSYSSDSICVTVDSNGTITGVSEGLAVVTVSYTKKGITKTDTVEVIVGDIVYRALCIGVGDYQNFPDAYGNIDLLGPPYDVDRIIDVFDHCKFGTDEVVFSTLVSLKDLNATKTAIISAIASSFSGADDNDISYFYFSGHGISYEGISYLCPTEVMYTSPLSAYIGTNELESALSAIPGRKVVILDSCHSGGFIGKGKGEITISKEELISFNDEIINVFSQAQSKGLLTTNQYKVLTSCHYDQSSWETSPHPDGNPYGVFTRAFCNGCGYDDGVSYADSNSDTKITLDELYEYIRDFITDVFDYDQDVQVFPKNSNFTIVEH